MIRRSTRGDRDLSGLETTVREISAQVPTVLIENAPGRRPPAPGRGVAVRRALGLSAVAPVVLYTGTFEAYQGLDFLYAAMRLVVAERPLTRSW